MEQCQETVQHEHSRDCGAMVVIRFPADRHQSCRNALIKNLSIHRNYSEGEVEGIASGCQIKVMEGDWPRDRGVAILSFESYPAAERWTFSVPDIKQPDFLGGIDMILVPCCEHKRIHRSVVQIMDMEIIDRDALAEYSAKAAVILEKHDARQLVSTDVMRTGKKVKGWREGAGHIIINTWESVDCYEQAYHGDDNRDLLQQRQASACTNVCVCEMEPLIHRH